MQESIVNSELKSNNKFHERSIGHEPNRVESFNQGASNQTCPPLNSPEAKECTQFSEFSSRQIVPMTSSRDTTPQLQQVKRLSLKEQAVMPFLPSHLQLSSQTLPRNIGKNTSHAKLNPSSDLCSSLPDSHRMLNRRHSMPNQLNSIMSPNSSRPSSQVTTLNTDVFSSLIPIKILLSNNIELEEVTLRKKDMQNDFLGLILEVFPETIDSNAIVSISRITPGGLCSKDGRLKKYDRFLKINGYRVKDFEGALEQLRKNNVTLTVARATDKFLDEHIKSFTCSLFGRRPSLRPTRSRTYFENGSPRIVNGVDEARLEIEMIIYMRRVEKIRKGNKKVQHDLYNLDDDEYFFADHSKVTIRGHKRKSFLGSNQYNRTSDGYRILDEPFHVGMAHKNLINTPYRGYYTSSNEYLRMQNQKPLYHNSYYNSHNNRYSCAQPAHESGYFKSYGQMYSSTYSRSLPFNYPPYHNGYLPPQKLYPTPCFNQHHSPYIANGYYNNAQRLRCNSTGHQFKIISPEQTLL